MQEGLAAILVLGKALLILGVGFLAMKVIVLICEKALDKSRLDSVLHKFIVNAVKVFIWIIILVSVLSSLGIATSTFITILGAGGIAIALALKDSLGNVAGGIILLVTKPFKKGDYINIIETSGQVESMDLLYTTLKTFDNKVIEVPNGKITNAVLINYSKEEWRRVDCVFSIGYQDSIEKAKEILLTIAESHEDILIERTPIIGVAGHFDSSIHLDLKVWCKNENYWDVKYFLEENVKLAFDEAGITIPFPQMEVRVRK